MCPGIRPATGWMPNTTSTPRSLQDLGEFGRGVVRAGDREPVAGHDHDALRVVEQDRDVVGLHRAHRPVRTAPADGSRRRARGTRRTRCRSTVRPMALAIAIVRIVPLAPTSVPAISSRTFARTRPDAATASPVKALSSEITIGTSAPPIGRTSSTPSTRPDDQQQVGPERVAGQHERDARRRPPRRRAAP